MLCVAVVAWSCCSIKLNRLTFFLDISIMTLSIIITHSLASTCITLDVSLGVTAGRQYLGDAEIHIIAMDITLLMLPLLRYL